MKKLLLLILGYLTLLPGYSQSFDYNGIAYNITSESDKTCEVTRNNDISGDIIIPEKVTYEGTEYSVTSIGGFAFFYCIGLPSIEIPNSVISIGFCAFGGCRNLTSIVIPNSVTSIGERAFIDCIGLTSVTIGNSVIFIGGSAFEGCSMTSVTIPNSVTEIGRGAFSHCSSLISINVDNENPSYKSEGGVLYSKNLQTIIQYPAGLSGNFIIPNSVTEIGSGAFEDCSGLTSVTIPNSVTSIGPGAFMACSSLTSINVDNENPSYKSEGGVLYSKNLQTIIQYPAGLSGNFIIPNSVTEIGSAAFYVCTGLTSIEIPNSVTSIGDWAFVDCSGLTSVTIPNSVTSIGERAFINCTGLTSVTIPNSVTSIGSYGFAHCSGLTNVEIPNSVTSIGEGAFWNCTGLTSVEIPNSVTSIGECAFLGCSGLDCRIVMPTQLQSFDISCFADTPATLIFKNRNLSITDHSYYYTIDPTYYAAGDTYEQLRALVPAEYVFLLKDAVLDDNSPVFIGANSECTWESTVDYQFASGFQFDLTLPQGLSIRNISAGENSDNPYNVEIAFSQIANGDYRVIGYSKDASEIGVLTLAFEFVSDGSLQRGDILCHNAVMSISDRQLDCTDQTVAVTGYNITVDLPETIVEGDSITLPSPFGEEAASVAYTWSTENPAIATVEGNEILHAKKAGVTNVLLTVEDPAFTKTFTTPIEVLAALWGDVDGNGVCNVQDLVAMVNYILERNPENFDTKLADIDHNGSINVVDLTALIRIILSYENTEKMQVKGVYGRSSTSDITFGEVSPTTPGLYTLPIIITPTEDYTALQADITLPEGLTIENITLGAALKSHTLDYSVTGETSARFIVYSTSLTSIAPAEDGVLANLIISGRTEGEIGIDDILACDTACNGYEIARTAKELGDTSGLGAVGSEDATFDIFTLEGVYLMHGATRADIDALSPGIYIIGGKKVIVK